MRNGNLIVTSLACLTYMCVVYWRMARFSLRFARITPVPSFKTGNLCFFVVCCCGLGNSALAFLGLWIPGSSPIAQYLGVLTFINTSLLLVVLYLGARLVDKPGKRLRRFGERLWSMVTVIRLYPLWRVVTTTIPEVMPPITMPWLSAVFHDKMDVLRDARIIELLDALHRLDVVLWNEASHQEWPITAQQPVNRSVQPGDASNMQARHVEQIAQHDAARIIVALANYTPSSHASPSSRRIATAIATLTHPPSFSAQEVHYLELVASAFQRLYSLAAEQPHLIVSRFDVD